MIEEKKHTIPKKPLSKRIFKSVFKDPNIREKAPFLGFLYAMIILYIGIGYYAEGLVKQIAKTGRKVKEKRAEYISIKSTLMDLSKQTKLAKQLEHNQTGIIESVDPPKKIITRD